MIAGSRVASPAHDLAASHATSKKITGSRDEVSFELVSTRSAFNALEDDWNRLVASLGGQAHAFHTFNWHWHWANHFAASQSEQSRLLILVVRRGHEAVLIWPLVRNYHLGIARIGWMGEPVSQYGDVIALPGIDVLATMRCAIAYLRNALPVDIIHLRKVRDDAVIAQYLAESGATKSDINVAPCLDMSSTKAFAEIDAKFSTKDKRNRRRLARRLNEEAKVSIEKWTDGTTASELAGIAIELKLRWISERGLVSQAIVNPRTRAFFQDVASGRSKSCATIIWCLKCDDEPAALVVGFRQGEHFAFHINVFALKWEKSGVGVLLLERVIEQAYADGIRFYDFLAPGAPYKFDWANTSTGIADWTMPLTLKGHAYARVYLDIIRSRAKTVIAGLPDPIRKRLAAFASQ